MVTSLVELLGILLVFVGAYLTHPALVLVVLGVLLVLAMNSPRFRR